MLLLYGGPLFRIQTRNKIDFVDLYKTTNHEIIWTFVDKSAILMMGVSNQD